MIRKSKSTARNWRIVASLLLAGSLAAFTACEDQFDSLAPENESATSAVSVPATPATPEKPGNDEMIPPPPPEVEIQPGSEANFKDPVIHKLTPPPQG